MQYRSRCMSCAVFAIALGSLGCAPAAEDPNVTYEAGDPLTHAAGSSAGSASVVAGSGGSVSNVVAGSGGSSATAGRGGAGAVAVAGSGGASDGGSAGSGSSTTGLTSVSFDVTTLSQGGRYSPKNIGAIWVQNSSGAFVKSLEVWAAQRRRYLTKYNAAVGTTGSVDVTTTATLSSHKAHHVTWNLKDKSGAAVASGKYTMLIELTDADATGKSYSVDFDLTQGAQSVTPATSQYYSSMALKIQ